LGKFVIAAIEHFAIFVRRLFDYFKTSSFADRALGKLHIAAETVRAARRSARNGKSSARASRLATPRANAAL